MAEFIKPSTTNIDVEGLKALVDITLAVEQKVRAIIEQEIREKHEKDVKRLARHLADAREKFYEREEEIEALTEQAKKLAKENHEIRERGCEYERQVEDLTGQKERQAAKITELTDVRDRQKKLIDDLEKHADSLERELEAARQGRTPFGEEELQKKLDKAMAYIDKLSNELTEIKTGAADPRWIPLSEKHPQYGASVIACTKRGKIYIAQETEEGWKHSTGKMSEPVAWMPLPKTYKGGEA